MREYIYIWINECVPLNDFGNGGFLIQKRGFSLSSKYRIKDTLVGNILSFTSEKIYIPDNFFSSDFSDIKAFVGENGTGKTTILKTLYKIIGKGFDNPVDYVNGFVIFYTDDGEKIHYYKSPECSYVVKASFAIEDSEKYGELPCKSPRTIFYTAAVNDEEIKSKDFQDCYDISTNALLYSDCRNRYNETLLSNDCFSAYVVMEMVRKIKFATLFYDIFENNDSVKFRVPNGIRVKLIKIDNHVVEKLSKESSKKKEWLELANSIEDFEDYFRLVVLCNHIIGYPQNLKESKDYPSIIENPEEIKKMGLIAALKEYSKGNKIENERNLAEYVEYLLSLVHSIDEEQQRALKEYKKIKPNLKGADGIFFDLNDEKHRNILRIFIEGCQKITWITPFFSMKWRTQSSGEETFIKFYSRFYDVLKNYREDVKKENIHLFIDEADLYLHPEWQRCWMYEFIEIMRIILKKIYPSDTPKIQMFFSTHSPFIITDLPKENLVLLKRNEGYTPLDVLNEPYISPFGANLYDLLSDSFFIKSSIGLFSERKVKAVAINDSTEKSDVDTKNEEYILDHIGDPIVKSLLRETMKRE